MPAFNYRATNTAGKTVSGTMSGLTRDEVIDALVNQSLRPFEVKIVTSGNKLLGGFLKPKVKLNDLVLFTRQLSTMVSAGVPLLRALTTLQNQTENKTLKDIVGEIVKDVQGGSQLADAFEKHPKVFSDIYVNMVRAGEAAGIVDDILKRLASQVEKTASMHKKIKSASTYPLVLLTLTVGAFFGLMIFVIPMIGGILKDLGGPDAQLPAMTQAMMAVSDFLVKYAVFIVIGIIAAIYALRRYHATAPGKLFFHKLFLRIPILNTLLTKIAVARFTRTFAALIGAGVSVVEALKVTARALGNEVFRLEVEKAASEVVNGKQLSSALQNSKLFPGIVPQMLAVGEETGQTDKVLVKVAEFYEEETDATIDSLSSILEPVMIVIMGGMVGIIAANVMGPIASLSQNIN
ncbi:MAG TPA: type II secretion system F family protein [Candidatus Saccharibacteria bacterium]|nr:type II secretion system F family protein [Candidatus Saccharibacteria bacterium]